MERGNSNVVRFCCFCGGLLSPLGNTPHRVCSECGQPHYRNPAVGVAVVVIKAGQVLLVRRARGRYAGRWCIPCGYVEWDEDVRQAARREMREETGLEVRLLGVCDVRSNFHDPDKQSVGIWFWGEPLGGGVKPGDDVDAANYFRLEELPPLAFPTDAQVLEDIRAGRLCPPRVATT